MEALSTGEIISATGGEILFGDKELSISNISTDSRTIIEGDLFLPLKGNNFDGHDFIKSAFERGAALVLTSRDIEDFPGKTAIKVKDTLKAYQDIAKYYINKHRIPFVAVTGSVGKTSTKDMIYYVLKQKYNVLKSEGNFNNEIGLPKTLLNLNKSHSMAVVEMGMSGFGEIHRLSEIVNPQTAVITNIGVSHIEKLGSRENILKAKLEILDGMGSDGNLIMNGDDDLLSKLSNLAVNNVYHYGINTKKGLNAYNIVSRGESGTKYNAVIDNTEYTIELNVPGEHNVYNSLAAIQTGLIYNVPISDIIKGLKEYVPSKMRLNILKLDNGVKIIDDCYNASPQSMKAALSVLSETEGRRRIAVLGDMFELGDYSKEGHYLVGKYAVESKADYLLLIGNNILSTAVGAKENGMDEDKIKLFEDMKSLCEFLKDFIKSKDAILVKGSRGMKMEEVVNYLREVK